MHGSLTIEESQTVKSNELYLHKHYRYIIFLINMIEFEYIWGFIMIVFYHKTKTLISNILFDNKWFYQLS